MRHGRDAGRIDAVEHLHVQKDIVELRGKFFGLGFRKGQTGQTRHVDDFILCDFQWLQAP
jgi:hypothetical protein